MSRPDVETKLWYELECLDKNITRSDWFPTDITAPTFKDALVLLSKYKATDVKQYRLVRKTLTSTVLPDKVERKERTGD